MVLCVPFIHIIQGCVTWNDAIVCLPNVNKVTLRDMGKIDFSLTTTTLAKIANRVHISWNVLFEG